MFMLPSFHPFLILGYYFTFPVKVLPASFEAKFQVLIESLFLHWDLHSAEAVWKLLKILMGVMLTILTLIFRYHTKCFSPLEEWVQFNVFVILPLIWPPHTWYIHVTQKLTRTMLSYLSIHITSALAILWTFPCLSGSGYSVTKTSGMQVKLLCKWFWLLAYPVTSQTCILCSRRLVIFF